MFCSGLSPRSSQPFSQPELRTVILRGRSGLRVEGPTDAMPTNAAGHAGKISNREQPWN